MARNRKVLWRGQPVTHPFQVVITPDDQQPVVLDAALLQTPVVSRAAARLVTALLALAVLLLAGWFLAVRPVAESAAREAVEQPLATVAEQAQTADKKADAAGEKADVADGKAVAAAGDPKPSAKAGKPPAGTAKTGVSPARLRLRAQAAPGATVTDAFDVPDRSTLVVTDVVLQNPQGDTGRVEVLVGQDAILTLALANFRDIDYHFVSPVEVPAGRSLSLRTACRTPGLNLTGTVAARCQTLLLISGSNRTVRRPQT